MSGSSSIGKISLDLLLNSSKFNKQMSGLSNNINKSLLPTIKKVGAALAGSFAVKQIKQVASECIKLGSNLAEVQNVVDTTFTSMSDKVNEFANNAIELIGLSETSTKKYMGTLGAMSKSFGFTEKSAFKMSQTLTTLSADVASFYNISNDEAFNKLKSVYTGETESLKELGVVMTQAALDSYAMSNGFGKTTKDMSEAEKVALRYSFVLDKLKLAQGDFSKTQNSWANQTRILSERFNKLKATIGQGLIAALLPLIQTLNTVLAKIQAVANAFSKLMQKVFGRFSKKSSGVADGVKEIYDNATTGLETVAGATGSAADETNGAANAAGKAAKKLASMTTGIDELNIVSPNDSDSGSGSGGGSGDVGGGLGDIPAEIGDADTALTPLEEKLEKIKSLIDDCSKAFSDNFMARIKGADFSGVIKGATDIWSAIKKIFTDEEVLSSARNWAVTVSGVLGSIAADAIVIGTNIASNLAQGIGNALLENTEGIKTAISTVFDVSSQKALTTQKVWDMLADWSTVFTSDSAKKITSDIASIFISGFTNALTSAVKFGKDIANALASPFINNQSSIKAGLQKFVDIVSVNVETVKKVVTNMGDKWQEVYDTYISPALGNIGEGLSKIVGAIVDGWNTYIAPVLQRLADKFQEVAEKYVNPAISSILEFVGKLFDAVSNVWNNVLAPLVAWVVSTLAPLFAESLENIGIAFSNLIKGISEVVQGIFETLQGVIDFITGVFSCDWSKAWEGIKQIVSGILKVIKGIFDGTLGNILEIAGNMFEKIKNKIKEKLSALFDKIAEILGNINGKFILIFTKIHTFVSSKINAVKTAITNTMNEIKVGCMKALNWLDVKFTNIFTGIKNTVVGIFTGMWNGIKGVINTILGGVESLGNGVVKGINTVINALNRLSFDVPDWIPGIGGNTFGFNIPTLSPISIPRLAEGAYVKANTPQLAMIGDNKTQGEIVAPEGKLQELLDKAQKTSSSDELVSIMSQVLEYLKMIYEAISGLELSTELDARTMITWLKNNVSRGGATLVNG